MRIPACAVVAFVLTPTTALPQPSPASVPNYLLAAANGPLYDFALLAAHARLPVGLELHESDDPQPFRPTVRLPEPDDVEQTVSLSTVIATFNSTHRDYRAELVDGVMVVRPRVGRAAFLDGPSGLESVVTVTGVPAALRTIFSPLDPGLLGPWVGSGSGRHALDDLTAQLTIDGSPGHTVLSTLNQILEQRQAGWYVVTRRRDGAWDIVKFGRLLPNFGKSETVMRPRAVP